MVYWYLVSVHERAFSVYLLADHEAQLLTGDSKPIPIDGDVYNDKQPLVGEEDEQRSSGEPGTASARKSAENMV